MDITAQYLRTVVEEASTFSKEVNDAVSTICEEALVEAKAGRVTLRVRAYGFSDSACNNSRDKWPKLNSEIYSRLIDRGFCVEMVSEERQFVNLWLEVSW